MESFCRLNFRRWKFFVGGNFSSVEIFRRWKFFVGGNFSPVEIFRRWKFFAGGNVSPVEMFRRWKCFAGGNVSPVETFRRWKCFAGGNFVTWPNFRHFPPTKLSPIRYLAIGKIGTNCIPGSAIKSLRAQTCFSSEKIFCFYVYFTYKIIIAQLSCS